MPEKAAVLGFAYGFRLWKNAERVTHVPGASNEALIRVLFDRYFILWRSDLILQQQLAYAVRMIAAFSSNTSHIVCEITEHHNKDQYLDTDEVAYRGVEFAHQNGYTVLYILAAPTFPLLHRWFAVKKTREFAAPYNIQVEALKTGWIPSDPSSAQWWTRSFYANWWYTATRVILHTHHRGE